MIRYRRRASGAPPAPKVLCGGKDGSARKERDNNQAHITAGTVGDMKFDLYRHDEVRAALHGLFGRKCVFCESSLLGNQPGDIEHFRPKGRVVAINPKTGKREKVADGYHWLAASWSNLLLSCADCNRPRRQEDGKGAVRTLGKSSFFPVRGKHAAAPWQVRAEGALLLDPCRDDPELHLAFTDEGGILALPDAHGSSARGEATIEHCALDRAELVQMRLRHARTVKAAIRHIIAAIEQGRDPEEDLDDLLAMLDPRSPYVAFTRHLVRTGLAPYLTALGLSA